MIPYCQPSSTIIWWFPWLGVSMTGGFHEWGYPKVDGLEWNLPLKWMVWRYLHLWKPANMFAVFQPYLGRIGWDGYLVFLLAWGRTTQNMGKILRKELGLGPQNDRWVVSIICFMFHLGIIIQIYPNWIIWPAFHTIFLEHFIPKPPSAPGSGPVLFASPCAPPPPRWSTRCCRRAPWQRSMRPGGARGSCKMKGYGSFIWLPMGI